MAKDKVVQKLDERLYDLSDKVLALAFVVEDALTTIIKILKDADLPSYEEYAILKNPYRSSGRS